MRYLKVHWEHQHPDQPHELYSEISEGYEVRKVEVFASGRMGFASSTDACGDSHLGESIVPTAKEISAHSEFQAHDISPDEFEEVWIQATSRRCR
jgi:hypothetical protein